MEENSPVLQETTEQIDPWNKISELATNGDALLLLGGPSALVLIIALIGIALVTAKRRREKRQLDEVMTIADQPSAMLPADGDEKDDDASAESSGARKIAAMVAERGQSGPTDVKEVLAIDDANWLGKLRTGLSKTREQLLTGLSFLRTSSKLDDATIEKIHAALYQSDIGVAATDYLIEQLRARLKDNANPSWEAIAAILKDEMQKILTVSDAPINEPESGPFVILVVGVNGVGKTTTIGKLAAHFLAEERSVLMCAADTFRAAAIDQLKVWGERLGVDVVAHQQGSDPAAVAFDAVRAAKARKIDVLLVDTAGRLHNKQELMDELAKIGRVLGKDLAGAPHEIWLVIDATTGQNALQQAKAFKECVDVSGVIVTKIDGTAKGGVLVGVCAQQKLPIRYVGVGEKAADLRRFQARDYAESMF